MRHHFLLHHTSLNGFVMRRTCLANNLAVPLLGTDPNRCTNMTSLESGEFVGRAC